MIVSAIFLIQNTFSSNVLPLLLKQKKTTTMMITVNDLAHAVAVEWRSTLQGSINDNNKNNNKDGLDGI